MHESDKVLNTQQPAYPLPQDLNTGMTDESLLSPITSFIPNLASAISDSGLGGIVRTAVERALQHNPNPAFSSLLDSLGVHKDVQKDISSGYEPGDWNRRIDLRKRAMQHIKDQGFLTDEGYASLEEAVAHFEGPILKFIERAYPPTHAYFRSPSNAVSTGIPGPTGDGNWRLRSAKFEDVDERAMAEGDMSDAKMDPVEDLANVFLHEFGHYLDWNPEGGGQKGHLPWQGKSYRGARPPMSMLLDKETGSLLFDQAGDETATDYRGAETEFDRVQSEALAHQHPGGNRKNYEWKNPREYFAVMFEEAAKGAAQGVVPGSVLQALDANPWMRGLFEKVIPKESLDVAHEAAAEKYYEGKTGLEGNRPFESVIRDRFDAKGVPHGGEEEYLGTEIDLNETYAERQPFKHEEDVSIIGDKILPALATAGGQLSTIQEEFLSDDPVSIGGTARSVGVGGYPGNPALGMLEMPEQEMYEQMNRLKPTSSQIDAVMDQIAGEIALKMQYEEEARGQWAQRFGTPEMEASMMDPDFEDFVARVNAGTVPRG